MMCVFFQKNDLKKISYKNSIFPKIIYVLNHKIIYIRIFGFFTILIFYA